MGAPQSSTQQQQQPEQSTGAGAYNTPVLCASCVGIPVAPLEELKRRLPKCLCVCFVVFARRLEPAPKSETEPPHIKCGSAPCQIDRHWLASRTRPVDLWCAWGTAKRHTDTQIIALKQRKAKEEGVGLVARLGFVGCRTFRGHKTFQHFT